MRRTQNKTRPLPHNPLTRVVASVAGALTDTVDEWLGVRYAVAKRWQVRACIEEFQRFSDSQRAFDSVGISVYIEIIFELINASADVMMYCFHRSRLHRRCPMKG